MNHFRQTPDAIEPYFLLRELRDHEQTEWEHELKGGEQRVALTRTFEDGEMISFFNTGSTVLSVALVAGKNDPLPPDALTLAAGAGDILPPAALGKPSNRFLAVKNMSLTEKGDYRVAIG